MYKTKTMALKAEINKEIRFLLPEAVMARYNPQIKAAQDDAATTLNIYDMIGEDWWTGAGMTSKTVGAFLERNKDKDISININSPGGDFFEGLTMYNMIKEHNGNVNIRILGLAASAASVIAMAGDNIKIAEAGFFMIHNAWAGMFGNKNELRDLANTLDQFDKTMAGIYTKQTGISEKEIIDMMDAESWIAGPDAVAQGFAHQFLDSDQLDIEKDVKSSYSSSLKEVDVMLAKAGMTRAERRKHLKEITGTPCAAIPEDPTPCAGNNESLNKAIMALTKTLKS